MVRKLNAKATSAIIGLMERKRYASLFRERCVYTYMYICTCTRIYVYTGTYDVRIVGYLGMDQHLLTKDVKRQSNL